MLRGIYDNFMSVFGQKPLLFISSWAVLFALVTSWLLSVGLAPAIVLGELDNTDDAPTIVDRAQADQVIDVPVSENADPVRVVIDAIDVDTTILNPDSAKIEDLDQALTYGAVHYPGSGSLEDISNMFLFGHSSHLPVVHNQSYRAFNNLENLEEGNLIRVQSETREYHYRVDSVKQVKAEDAWVQFDSSVKKLTLSTCNNFGSKQDRFVVEASFIGSLDL